MADFYITNRARFHMLEIEERSTSDWGETRTKRYMSDLLAAFQKIADDPKVGNVRKHRLEPFLMAPAEQHYAIYAETEKGIVIAAVLHKRRDIEAIIRDIGPTLDREIENL
uniref:Toxin ParE1/3/4 n=1 Tax=Candidatus Kentrum sp. LFY TaxID=2126342 RepID=A0A450UNV7_9GAMM|nr:MAG: toxin ParE1/3/4 [Candidatus Kentron sp. LFY]VFJ94234.1 MAG: toxin ParE1/3/4 [Candidatus Kentron sp. LFY]